MRRNREKRKDRTAGRPQRPNKEVAGRPWIFRGAHRGRLTRRNVTRHELIGLKAKVIRASHPELVGIEGYVADETRNTIVIMGLGRSWVVPKAVADFELELEDGSRLVVRGEDLLGRPEMRLKGKR
ncbi:MAG: ribonuclease P protein component 1 [Thermococci archaeon]|nr:ribonuclease P protein component 1 [Thermococci archaeon]